MATQTRPPIARRSAPRPLRATLSSTRPSGDGLTVQETAERTGLSEHTLRYYERAGLLTAVRRDGSSGHRRYSADDVARISTLACLRATGMPLDQMRRYFTLAAEGGAPRTSSGPYWSNRKARSRSACRQCSGTWTTCAARSTTGKRSRPGRTPSHGGSPTSLPPRPESRPEPKDFSVTHTHDALTAGTATLAPGLPTRAMPPRAPGRRSRRSTFERRDARPARRPDRHPLLRRLPLRPAHRAQRVGRRPSTPWCPGHEIVGRVAAGRRRGHEGSRPATSPASAAWSTPAAPAPTAREGLEQFCENGFTGTYNGPEHGPGGADLRRLLDQHRRRRATSCCASRTSSIPPAPRRCSAPASPPTRRCATGRCGAGQEGRRRRPRRARPHGRQARPRAWARTCRSSPPRRTRRTTRSASARDEVVVSQERGRDGEACRQLRLHPRHRRRAARPRRLPRAPASATARWCLVGAPAEPHPSPAFTLIFGRRSGSPAR